MQLHVIHSNSAGNCYLLENDEECLIIECGVLFKKIRQALKFNYRKVAGCLLSHEHNDHSESIKDILGVSIPVYASQGTHNALGTAGNHKAVIVKSGVEYKAGNFTVMPFDVKHDVAEPLGFLIHHHETGLILFLTDSYYCEYKFSGLNNIIIEANYCQTILDRRLQDGANPKFLRDRVITSHMSLATCKEMLQANDLSHVNNIVLIHLSDNNSDASRFKKEVQEATGKVVHVAEAGLTIDFNKKPF